MNAANLLGVRRDAGAEAARRTPRDGEQGDFAALLGSHGAPASAAKAAQPSRARDADAASRASAAGTSAPARRPDAAKPDKDDAAKPEASTDKPAATTSPASPRPATAKTGAAEGKPRQTEAAPSAPDTDAARAGDTAQAASLDAASSSGVAVADTDTAADADSDDEIGDSAEAMPVPAGLAGDAAPLPDDWLNMIRASLRLGADAARTAVAADDTAAPALAQTVSLLAGDGAEALRSLATALPANTASLADAGAEVATPASDFSALLAAAAPSGTEVAVLAPGAGPVATAPAPASPGIVAPPPMPVPFEHPDFAEAFGERIVWITDAGQSSAKIEMNPQALGAVSVQVQVRDDTAQVAFSADNPATRAMLQQALPQLRELFAGQGLQLLRSQVEQRTATSRETGRADAGSSAWRERAGVSAPRRVSKLQLVDAYV